MSFARVTTATVDGVDGRRVTVECDVRGGLPSFTIVGMADDAVRETRERVRGAIANSGFEFPLRRITVNLAPAHLRKSNASFDLAIALAVLAASGQIDPLALSDVGVIGSLTLRGQLRHQRGTLPAAEAIARAGVRAIVAPVDADAEAFMGAGNGCAVLCASSLRGAVGALADPAAAQPRALASAGPHFDTLDLADVPGNWSAVEALEIAAAGGHSLLLLSDGPACGATMLVRRLPGLLAPLSRQEAIDVARLQSVAGLRNPAHPLELVRRPFRAPHPSISLSGMVGRGPLATPGEITLADRGVLYLDDVHEFARGVLAGVREAQRDGHVVIVRGQRAWTMPSRFLLVGHAQLPACEDLAAWRWLNALSDLFDLVCVARRPDTHATAVTTTPGAAARVAAAQVQRPHLPLPSRSALSGVEAPQHRVDRLIAVARTIAALGQAPQVGASHLRLARTYTSLPARAYEGAIIGGA